jgi:hypothetical protein
MAILPVARSMYLCDHNIGYEDAKVDLYGLFSALRPLRECPFLYGPFCVYAQLVDGLGEIPFRIDVVFADADELLFSSAP